MGSEYIGTVLHQLIQRLSLRLPSQCAICGTWPAHSICTHCADRFVQPTHRCASCAIRVPEGVRQCAECAAHAPPLDACLAVTSYAYPWSGLIAQFKFRDTPGWASHFARLLRSTPWIEPAIEAADMLIPIPLSAQRLQERGYNQALEIARALDSQKVRHGILLRTAHAPAQLTLSRQERLTAMQEAFILDPDRRGELQGKRIVLIDDVMTTGATLYAAATELRKAGVSHTTGMVLARTERQ
jgi:ComF family protein